MTGTATSSLIMSFQCLTLHGSPPNLTGHQRRGLVFQYRASDAYQLADNLWEDGGLLICGKPSDQVRCESAVFRLPRFRHRTPHYGSIWRQESDWSKEMNEKFIKEQGPEDKV